MPEAWLDESVDELPSFLDALSIEDAYLCGVCVGGAIALLFSAQEPSRVRRIAVPGTCCYGDEKITRRVQRLYPTPETLPSDWLRELERHYGKKYVKDFYRIF